MPKQSNFTTHLIQYDVEDEPLATTVTEDNTTILNAYKVAKYSLGHHFDMNMSNNYYVTLKIGGLNSWRHIVGTLTVSNYGGGFQRKLFGYASNNPGVSATYTSTDVMSTVVSSNSQTINHQASGFLAGIRLADANAYTHLQWAFRTGKYHPMVWFDFTVASGSASHLPDIGDIVIHATNSTI